LPITGYAGVQEYRVGQRKVHNDGVLDTVRVRHQAAKEDTLNIWYKDCRRLWK